MPGSICWFSPPSFRFLASSKSNNTELALVVDGKALGCILINRHEVAAKVYSETETTMRVKMTAQFLSIARHCKAVVACRVSPAQKAAIVKVVRKGIKPQPLTLAIGMYRRCGSAHIRRT